MTFEAWWQANHEGNVPESAYARLKLMACDAWHARDGVDHADTQRLEWLSHRERIADAVGAEVVRHSIHDLRRAIDKARDQ
jgi:hypothetical protein